jgi:hypothetical protein
MSNHEHNRFATTRRHGRTWAWLTAAAVLVLVVVGVFFTTGRWGEDTTRTGGGATAEAVPPGAGPNQPGAVTPDAGPTPSTPGVPRDTGKR